MNDIFKRSNCINAKLTEVDNNIDYDMLFKNILFIL